MNDERQVVIVGGGLAGASAAFALRDEGFEGQGRDRWRRRRAALRATADVQELPARRGPDREGARPTRSGLRGGQSSSCSADTAS